MKHLRKLVPLSVAALSLAFMSATSHAEPPLMRAIGNFSANKAQVDGAERPFFAELAKNTGISTNIQYNPMDVVGIQAPDALRLLRSGAFDVMSVQIGMASRDDPFFEGIDLIGVAPTLPEVRKVVDAYREAFDKRLQERFRAKVLTLWPFGAQVTFCNADMKSLDDLRGQKVRVYTPTMAALMNHLGATPVTLQLNEVYPSLQRGVVTCGVTSPTTGNSAKWPEVATHILPMSLAGSIQGHFVSLDHWNKYTPEQQQKLEAEFKKLEEKLWDIAENVNEDAMNCNTGKDPCTTGTKFNMTEVKITEADYEKLREGVVKEVLPIWKKTCNAVDPQCSQKWNDTVGQATGLKIE
jgi:TRAP-type C4-dicarboxylate transport system substrate-binding protein